MSVNPVLVAVGTATVVSLLHEMVRFHGMAISEVHATGHDGLRYRIQSHDSLFQQ